MRYFLFSTSWTGLVLVALLTACSSDSESPSIRDSSDGSPGTWTDATVPAGLEDFQHDRGAAGNKWFPETMSGGGGFADLDADGDLDIVLVSGGPLQSSVGSIRTYFNDGSGQFEERTIDGLQDLTGYGMGLAAGDLDNDGDTDLVYSTWGPNAILINEGTHFRSIQSELLSQSASDWSTAILLFDADRDGWLDILFGNYVQWTPNTDIYCTTDGSRKGYCTPELYEGVRARFLRNTGQGSFTDATDEFGFDAISGKTLGLAHMDHNRDGWPDIIVANDTDPDQLLVGSPEGYTDIGVTSGMAFDERGRARAGMGVDAAVTDASGSTSIFVGNFSDEMVGVYRQLSDRAFLDRAASSGVGPASLFTLAFGVKTADFNGDGFLDVAVANGHVEETIEDVRDNVRYRQSLHLFVSDGEGRFVDKAPAAGMDSMYVARALAVGDVDGNLTPDILVVENGGGAHLWLNPSPADWLGVRLNGSSSNRNGIGALVTLWSNGQSQERVISTGGSYLTTVAPEALFALPGGLAADSVVVSWPSGAVGRVDQPGTGWLMIDE